ncbi:hypothetical protein PAE9249_04548 [Paenibacillus sp. CECT 9249]|uniref:FtsK/SpoIIIE domain-containing protein n=1 Tax=Paenibacillus sp. CECT 9249 TaxID=2845385 RepID=UPI001E4A25BB|nr:FtsK/SpoIIIE domain-containing protein [Paenibacillus sp. CECT 9249]CAH0122011.1 hypothetical protein PAE9249_04548 [Paenibacillus sp. CECT 9249]
MSIIQKVRKQLSSLFPPIKRFLAWWRYDDQERLRNKVIEIWIRSAQEELLRAHHLLNDIANKPYYEVDVPQNTIDWVVRSIAHYEVIKRPTSPLDRRLALRLGMQAPALRRRLLWLLSGFAFAVITTFILGLFTDFPLFHWFPIVILTGLFFYIVCLYTGYKLFPFIRSLTADHTACEHLFHAYLSQIFQQANALLHSRNLKKVSQINTALHAISYQKLQRGSVQESTNNTVMKESKPVPDFKSQNQTLNHHYYPMKQAWERFLTEVLHLKDVSNISPIHHDLGQTEVFIWDIPSVASTRWEENVTRIEAYLKKPVFFIHRDYDGIGTVGVEIAKQPLPKEIHFQNVINLHAVAQMPESVIVGVNSKGMVTWNYRKIPHGIVAGTTGAGKSTALYSVILQLQRQNHFPMFIDLKGGVSFGFVEDAGYPIATTKEAALELVKSAAQEVERREQLLKEWGVSPDIAVYNEMTGANLPELFVVFDEFAQFTDKWQGLEEGMSCLKAIAAKGRSNGVHLLIATQRPSQESLGSTDFRSNISFRCIGRMDSQTSSQIALGNGAAFERLPSTDYAGLFIVRGTDAPTDSLIKVPFINDMDFRRLFLEYRNPHEGYKVGRNIGFLDSRREIPQNFNDIF